MATATTTSTAITMDTVTHTERPMVTTTGMVIAIGMETVTNPTVITDNRAQSTSTAAATEIMALAAIPT